jgi:hypothetical protein
VGENVPCANKKWHILPDSFLKTEMKAKTCTGTLERFRRYVTSTRFDPYGYVEDYGDGETWTPAAVVLTHRLHDVLERLQLLAAAGASWRGKEVQFAHALYRCLRHKNADTLVAVVMSMADAPLVHVTMLLVTGTPDDESGDNYYVTVAPLRSFAIWWDGAVDTVQQLLSVLRLSPDDFAPYFPERHQWQKTTMGRLWAAQSRRWSPLRAAWCGAVVQP